MRKLLDKTNGGFFISKIKQIQSRIFEKLLTEHGIKEFNGAQGRILFVLWSSDDIPIKELSEKTGLAKTTLTSMLDRLEAQGHIKRSAAPNDRRTVNIRLTEKAKHLRKSYEDVSEEMNEIFYKGFTDDEIQHFENYLGKILENLTEKEHEYEQ